MYRFGCYFVPPWTHLGQSWYHLGVILEALKPIWAALGQSWGHLGAASGKIGAYFGLSWVQDHVVEMQQLLSICACAVKARVLEHISSTITSYDMENDDFTNVL